MALKKLSDMTEISPFPEAAERPCFKTYWQPFHYEGKDYRAGLYYHSINNHDSNEPELKEQHLCAPIEVVAQTRDSSGNNWGKLVNFSDREGKQKDIILPMSLITSERPAALIGQLSSAGLYIPYDTKNYRQIARYINDTRGAGVKTLTYNTGWAIDGSEPVFIFPDEIISSNEPEESGLLFDGSNQRHGARYGTGGNLAGWKEQIATYALGNPIIQLALIAGFAGVLLKEAGITGGGLHLYGDSGKGKTTAILAASSIWGHSRDYIKTWAATKTGLEGTAKAHTDTLLCLDELQDIDPKDLGQAVYNLANGHGKIRGNTSGGANEIAQWRVFMLSTGELSIREFLTAGGAKQMAGHTVRFIELPATKQTMGAFDELHSFKQPKDLAEHLEEASKTHYGHASHEFIRHLIKHKPDIKERIKYAENTLFKDQELSTEEARGARVLILSGLAGEIAIEAGILPWTQGEAFETARYALNLWFKHRGMKGFGHEQIQIIKNLKAFIDTNAMARMQNNSATHDTLKLNVPINNQAGYYEAYKNESGHEVISLFLFHDEGIKEACKTTNIKKIADTLKEIKALEMGADGRPKKQKKVLGRNDRFYHVKPETIRRFLDESETD